MRVQLGGARILAVARHTYYKYRCAPTPAEGIDIIYTITGIPRYDGIDIPDQYMYHYNLTDR
jgi:hypothetical protein